MTTVAVLSATETEGTVQPLGLRLDGQSIHAGAMRGIDDVGQGSPWFLKSVP
jgi:hypothetical protein